MFTALLPVVVLTAAALMTLATFYSVRVGVFAPVGEPRLAPGVAHPSDDTLAGSSELVRTVINTRPPEWQTATLHSLTDVEDFLDCLEARGVASRELTVVNNSTFAVRWK